MVSRQNCHITHLDQYCLFLFVSVYTERRHFDFQHYEVKNEKK